MRVYISASSNIDAEMNLRTACRALAGEYGLLDISSVYRNASYGLEGDDFLNAVVGFSTRQSPQEVLGVMARLHREAGREESGKQIGPRVLDLDLLLYGDSVINEPDVQVPRRDILLHAFVLGPLAELAPEQKHPVSGATMAELWACFDQKKHPLYKQDISLL